MAERKVLNKYYAPDFDPLDLPRNKRDKFERMKVRMMLPMSIRCNTCGEYLYRGKKFNSRKETILGEDYLGIKIFRFYMLCTRCSAEFTIKTDPQKADYETESNCSRNFEPWREKDEELEKLEKEKQEEESDAMKKLENRTLESKMEMDILDSLDNIKSQNAKNAKLTTEEIFHLRAKKAEEEEDEMVKHIVFKNSNKFIKRIDDQEEPAKISINNATPSPVENKPSLDEISVKANFLQEKNKKKANLSLNPNILIRKKRKSESDQEESKGNNSEAPKDESTNSVTSSTDKKFKKPKVESIFDLTSSPSPPANSSSVAKKQTNPKKLPSTFNY